jgi:hypothetical protein
MNVTAIDTTWSAVTASLTNGASLRTEFVGGTPPTLKPLTPMLSVAAGATVNWTVQALVLSGGLPVSGQSVVWQAATGISLQSTTATTNSSGIATKSLTVGPLTEGQSSSSTACLSTGSPCVTFPVFGARPEYATIKAVSGTVQSIAVSETASQITLRVLDVDGNPMAGGTVILYQAIYAWAPTCPVHGRCAQAELLATQAATATSALDGTVTFSPASLSGVATNVVGLAVIGNSSTVHIAIEQHP